jgi:uncharacterized protein YuzE
MSIPSVEQDAETGYAYVYLCEPQRGIVKESIELEKRDDDDPDALESLVLDFDRDGRLIGIEILGRAEKTLRPELLARAKPI